MKKEHPKVLLIVLLVVLVSGTTFGIGYKVGQSKSNKTAFSQMGNRTGNGSNMGNAAPNASGNRTRANGGGNQIVGEITAVDDKTITVKLNDGSSKMVLYSTSSSINKATQGSATDLKVGEKVVVFGTTDTNGSITAQNIQLNPASMGQPSGAPPQKLN